MDDNLKPSTSKPRDRLSSSDDELLEQMPNRMTSFSGFLVSDSSEDDDGEFGRFGPSFPSRRTFSQCDSPVYPLPEFMIYDSEDYSSCELIGGVSNLNLREVSHPPEDGAASGKDWTPKRKKTSPPVEESLDPSTKKRRSSKLDPEVVSGKDAISESQMEEQTSTGKESKDLLKPPFLPTAGESTSPKRKIEDVGHGSQTSFPDYRLPESASERTKTKPPVPVDETDTIKNFPESEEKTFTEDQSSGRESEELIKPPSLPTTGESSSPKRKIEDGEQVSQTSLPGYRLPESASKRTENKSPTPVDETDTTKNIPGSEEEMFTEEPSPRKESEDLPKPSSLPTTSTSPKRKIEDVEPGSETSLLDCLSPESALKRAKNQPPTPVDETDTTKNFPESEEKTFNEEPSSGKESENLLKLPSLPTAGESTSPKRKIEDVEPGSETSLPDCLSPESASKRSKMNPPTPVYETDTINDLPELEVKTEHEEQKLKES